MGVRSLVLEEIKDQVSEIHKLEVGTEQSEKAIKGMGVLMDKIGDIDKLDLERERLDVEREKIEIERSKLEKEEKDRKIKNRIAIGTTATGAAITVGMGLLAYVYEERGTISSKPGRSFVDKALNYFFKK